MTPVRYDLKGGRIVVGDRSLAIGTQTAQLLCALAAARGRRQTTPELTLALWPNAANEPGRPWDLIRTKVFLLRKFLAGTDLEVHSCQGWGYWLERLDESSGLWQAHPTTASPSNTQRAAS